MGWNSGFLARFLLYTALFFQSTTAEILKHTNQEFSQDVGSRDLKQEQGHEVHCSRERSRAAWNIIEEYLMPFVEREKYGIQRSCRLHPDNVLFSDQEEHKVHFDTNEWRCGYCKKSFMLEKFLDQHLDNRHYNLLNISQGKCLADLCGALHCDHIIKSNSPRSKCNPAASLRNRHMCESLAHNCFPVNEGPSASRLHELFMHQFCDAHTCSRASKPFPRGGRKHPSVVYYALSILTLMILPLFYVIVCLHRSEIRSDTQRLKRVPQKAKPS